MMMPWQMTKTKRTGTAARTREAYTADTCDWPWSWKIHTMSVHILGSGMMMRCGDPAVFVTNEPGLVLGR